MSKLRAGDEGGILHLAPVSLGSSETAEIPLRFIEIQGRPHILYAAEAPPAWISWATAARVRWRIGNQVFVGNARDRKSTRLNSSHDQISYAVFCLKKKTLRPSRVQSKPVHHLVEH